TYKRLFSPSPITLPIDIRRKATAPSKRPRQTRPESRANPCVVPVAPPAKPPSLLYSQSGSARAMAKAKVVATVPACEPVPKRRTAPFPSRKRRYCLAKIQTAISERLERPSRYRAPRKSVGARSASAAASKHWTPISPEKLQTDRLHSSVVR